jgi:hypothetical protein
VKFILVLELEQAAKVVTSACLLEMAMPAQVVPLRSRLVRQVLLMLLAVP